MGGNLTFAQAMRAHCVSRGRGALPWIPLYIIREDLPVLNEIVRADNALALLKHERGERWKAVLEYDLAADGNYSFWHVAGGPLAMPDADPLSSLSEEIPNPFEGWQQLRLNQHGQPFFRGNPPNMLDLRIMIASKRPEDELGMSSFGWIGNHYWALGRVAPEVTKKRWNKLRRDISKVAHRVPRGWLTRGTKAEVFALPHAFELLRSGARGAINPI
jgi:hypothetical protein